jgi:hypothetical protein
VQRSNLVQTVCEVHPALCELKGATVKTKRTGDTPMWHTVFYVKDICLKALRPFDISVEMVAPLNSESVTVFDTTGEHRVPILPALEDETPGSALSAAVDEGLYKVYAGLPKTDNRPKGCIIVLAYQFVIAIYYSDFGPAGYNECSAFVQDKCVASAPELAGGEFRGG